MDTEIQPGAGARFATVEDLERWVMSASDEEIVALYEASGSLSLEREAYGRELIDAARARLDDADASSQARAVAVAAD